MPPIKKTFQLLLIFSVVILLLACKKETQTAQENINQSAKKNGFTYNIYESFSTIPNYQSVAPSLFQEIIEFPKTVVIDVRTDEEISTGKITDTALEIDFYANDVTEQLQKLPKDVPYAIYCKSGKRSKALLKKMKQQNFTEVYDLYGGIDSWKKFKQNTHE